MLFRFLAGLMILVVLVAPAWSKGHSSANLRQTMQRLYSQLDEAVDHRDANGVVAYYDPDYQEFRGNREVDYQAYAATVAAVFSNASKINAKTTVQSVQPQGDGVIVVDRTHEVGVFKDPRTGKKVSFRQNETDRDFWVNDSGAWKIRQERILSLTVDKKPANG